MDKRAKGTATSGVGPLFNAAVDDPAACSSEEGAQIAVYFGNSIRKLSSSSPVDREDAVDAIKLTAKALQERGPQFTAGFLNGLTNGELQGIKLGRTCVREIWDLYEADMPESIPDGAISEYMADRVSAVLERHLSHVEAAKDYKLRRGFVRALADYIGATSTGTPNLDCIGNWDVHS